MCKSTYFAFCAIVAVAVAGCSKGDGDIQIDASKSPLTDQPNDEAFTIKVTKTPDAGYPLDKLSVKATPNGKDPIDLVCTPNDVNANAKLDTGDTVSCKEGTSNDLGTVLGGTDVTIDLYDTSAGDPALIAEATWTPAK